MTQSIHKNTKSALATPAEHFAIVGGHIHAFTDEDACWRFIHIRREGRSTDHPLYARYATRQELAA